MKCSVGGTPALLAVIFVLLVPRVQSELLENTEGAEYLTSSDSSTTELDYTSTSNEIDSSSASTDSTEDAVSITDVATDETVSSYQTENADLQRVSGGDVNANPSQLFVNLVGPVSSAFDNTVSDVLGPDLDPQSGLKLQMRIFVDRMIESDELGAPYLFWKNLFSEIERNPLRDVTWDDIFETLKETLRGIQKDSAPDTWNAISNKLSRIVSKRTWWPIVSVLNQNAAYLPPTNRPMFKIARELREIIGSAGDERPICSTFGVLPDPKSCSRFYVCIYTLGRWQSLRLECSGGREFNASIKKCVSPRYSFCSSQPSEETAGFNVPFGMDRYAS